MFNDDVTRTPVEKSFKDIRKYIPVILHLYESCNEISNKIAISHKNHVHFFVLRFLMVIIPSYKKIHEKFRLGYNNNHDGQ